MQLLAFEGVSLPSGEMPFSLIDGLPYLTFTKVSINYADIFNMDIPKISDLEKAIAEKRKQYLALQYEIFKFEKEGKTPPKEIIEQARKIRTSPEISKEQTCLN